MTWPAPRKLVRGQPAAAMHHAQVLQRPPQPFPPARIVATHLVRLPPNLIAHRRHIAQLLLRRDRRISPPLDRGAQVLDLRLDERERFPGAIFLAVRLLHCRPCALHVTSQVEDLFLILLGEPHRSVRLLRRAHDVLVQLVASAQWCGQGFGTRVRGWRQCADSSGGHAMSRSTPPYHTSQPRSGRSSRDSALWDPQPRVQVLRPLTF